MDSPMRPPYPVVADHAMEQMRKFLVEFGLTPSSRSLRREVAKLYIPLLRQHIFKENNVQFRMAEQVMSEADDAEVTDKFSQVEQQRGLTGCHDSNSSEVAHWEQALGEEE